jgi:hypothetical protein
VNNRQVHGDTVDRLRGIFMTGGLRALDIECSRILGVPAPPPREAGACRRCVSRRWRWADIVDVVYQEVEGDRFHWFTADGGRLCAPAGG